MKQPQSHPSALRGVHTGPGRNGNVKACYTRDPWYVLRYLGWVLALSLNLPWSLKRNTPAQDQSEVGNWEEEVVNFHLLSFYYVLSAKEVWLSPLFMWRNWGSERLQTPKVIVVGRIMVPQDVLISKSVHMLPYMAKGTLHTWLRTLRWGLTLGYSGGPNVIAGILENRIGNRTGQGDAKWEELNFPFLALKMEKGAAHSLRNVGGL